MCQGVARAKSLMAHRKISSKVREREGEGEGERVGECEAGRERGVKEMREGVRVRETGREGGREVQF